jgi:hypothetical protein
MTRWGFYLAGTAMVLTGIVGLLTSGPFPFAEIRFAAVSLVVHDAVLVPAVLAVGVLLTRTVPPLLRPYAQVALLVSGAVTVVALPFVIGAGRRPDIPSALPLDYGRGLLWVLAAIWVTTALIAAARIGLRRAAAARRSRPRPAARTRPRSPAS